MVTHIHPDHYGLAGRVREASGAWIALHPADAALIHDRYERADRPARADGHHVAPARRARGEMEELQNASMPVRALRRRRQPDVLLEDGDEPDMPGWDLSAIWTPGHSPGHLCFWEPANQLMLTGDCVLPRITPNVNLPPAGRRRPARRLPRSLEKLGTYDAEGSPAHEWRYVGHRDRRASSRPTTISDSSRSSRRSATATAPRGRSPQMTWSRPWDDTDRFMRRSAIGEAYAHLRTLEVQGVVREVEGEPSRWELLGD